MTVRQAKEGRAASQYLPGRVGPRWLSLIQTRRAVGIEADDERRDPERPYATTLGVLLHSDRASTQRVTQTHEQQHSSGRRENKPNQPPAHEIGGKRWTGRTTGEGDGEPAGWQGGWEGSGQGEKASSTQIVAAIARLFKMSAPAEHLRCSARCTRLSQRPLRSAGSSGIRSAPAGTAVESLVNSSVGADSRRVPSFSPWQFSRPLPC